MSDPQSRWSSPPGRIIAEGLFDMCEAEVGSMRDRPETLNADQMAAIAVNASSKWASPTQEAPTAFVRRRVAARADCMLIRCPLNAAQKPHHEHL